MLEVISFILRETIKVDKGRKRIADIKFVNFLWHIPYLWLHKTSRKTFSISCRRKNETG